METTAQRSPNNTKPSLFMQSVYNGGQDQGIIDKKLHSEKKQVRNGYHSNKTDAKNKDLQNSLNQRLDELKNPISNNDRHGPSQMSQGIPEYMLEGSDSDKRGSIYPNEADNYLDQSLVSAIQKPQSSNQFIDEEGEENYSSSRRLIRDTQATRSRYQPQNSHNKMQASSNHTRGNSTAAHNTKEAIYFEDQTSSSNRNAGIAGRTNFRADPIINKKLNGGSSDIRIHDSPQKSSFFDYSSKSKKKNKVAPLQLKNLTRSELIASQPTNEQDNKISTQQMRRPSKAMKTSITVNKGLDQFGFMNGQITMNSQQIKPTTYYGDGEDSEKEQSCLLDESVIKKQLYMPAIQGSKIQIQQDLGQKLVIKEEVKFHDEVEQENLDNSFYRIIDKDSIEEVESYNDRWPCIDCRKSLMRFRVNANRFAKLVVSHSMFETISIIVIVANSMLLALDDPLIEEPPIYQQFSDLTFQILYSIEMLFKIVAMGFFLNKGSYLRDAWNILDFIIIISGYLGYILEGGGANLSVLRSFRVIRPLRTISSVEGLRIIVSSLVNALPLLRDTIMVLIFFFLIFAIAGVQLFSGELKNRCFNELSGFRSIVDKICATDEDCTPGDFCGKSNENPNLGATSFDNVMYAMLLVFQTVTLEGWTDNMIDLEKAVGSWIIIYFIPIIFIGAFFLLNLTLAVIKSKFTEEMAKKKEEKAKGINIKRKIIIQKKGADDTDEEDAMGNKPYNTDEAVVLKDAIEGMTLAQIEENKEIPQDLKREIREKRRLEDLIKRMETALKQKEVKSKITPRDHLNKQDEALKQLQQQAIKAFSISPRRSFEKINYAEVFYSKNYDCTLETLKTLDSQKALLIEQMTTDPSLKALRPLYPQNNSKMKSQLQADMIKEDMEEQQEISEFQDQKNGLKHKGSSRNESIHFKNISAWLGDAFEIDKILNQPSAGKVMMSGMAGINNRKRVINPHNNSKINQTLKKAAYKALSRNFDIFEFLDNDIINFGDDELSQDENSEKHKVQVQIIQDEQAAQMGQPIALIDRRSTMMTSTTKLYHQNNTLQMRTSRDTEISKDVTMHQPQQYPIKESQKPPRATSLKRKMTNMDKHSDLNIVNQVQNKDQLEQILKKQPKDAQKQNTQLNSQIQNFKQSLNQSYRSTKSLSRSINNKNFSKSGDEKLFSETIRSKSEHKRYIMMHKDTVHFQTREKLMKQRRNLFFAEALRNLGKKKSQVKKERNEKLLRKRFIELNQGFELPMAKSPGINKKKLLRSGTTLQSHRRKTISGDTNKSNTSLHDFFDDDIKTQMNEVKQAFQQDNQQDDEILELEDVLQQQKKKVALKMKNHKFTSIQDIFESRQVKEVVEEPVILKPNIFKRLFAKDEAKAKKMPVIIKPYRKKILMGAKLYHEDLEDLRESDDDRDDVLKRLEDLHDVNHRSDIHVTGTLSIVFEKHQHDKKIMNMNYYYNIHPNEFIMSQQNNLITPGSNHNSFISNRGQFVSQNQNILVGTFGQPNRLESKESIYDINMSQGSAVRESDKSQEISSRNPSRNVSINKSRVGQPQSPSSFNKKKKNRRIASTMQGSKDRNKSTITRITSGIQQAVSTKNIPRPEALTNQQILKRLNHEMKKSKVFESVNFSHFPEKIKEKPNAIDLKKHKKAKKPIRKQLAANNKLLEAEEDSILSIDIQEEGLDVYIDMDIHNKKQIAVAKEKSQYKALDSVEWSGQDVMNRFDPYKARIALRTLNKIRIWPKGIYGYYKRGRVLLKSVMKSGLVDSTMTLCVFMNTIILAMDNYGMDADTQNTLQGFNTFFTIIFSVEMFLKILAIGIEKWQRDRMNFMDGAIVLMSLVELIFLSGKGALSAFRSIRMLRTLRVLRVARLLRGLKSMMSIIEVIQKSLSSFVYLGMLLFLFIFIYALLGMQLFGGQFKNQESAHRYNFDSFNNAFVTSFILLSMENWNDILFQAMGSDVNKGISVIYFVSCIFIGNFMLLNLFLAILLDSFTTVDEEGHDTPEKRAELLQKKKNALAEMQGQELIEGIEEVDAENKGQNKKVDKKKKKKKKNKNTQAQSNILDESIEIDMETVTQKKEQSLIQKQNIFSGIECENSLYIFSKQNKARRFFCELVQKTSFEYFILVLIILSSLKLIYDTYLFTAADDDLRVIVSSQFDIAFTIVFTAECLAKCIAFGFIQDNNSYLRETWSQMDFFIVITSLIDAIFTGVNIPIIKILRLLRILRPLRFISHNSSMKTVVIALLSSTGAILNVGIVVLCIFMMFAILGVNLFAGKLQYCSVQKYIVDNKNECFKVQGEWLTYDHNFDNVINGMLTLFAVATLEGWPIVMYTYTDITDIERGPQPNASPINAYFFVGFVFLGAFFFMNLFVGVLFMNFEAAQRDEKDAMLLEAHEIKWADIMKMICDAKPEIIKIPKNKVSQWMYKFTKAESKFDFFIMICIILNMVQMAINFEGQTLEYTNGLEYSNYVFTAIFALEALLKLIGNGSGYFNSTWNKFDFFVVLSSFIDIVMGQLSSTSLKFLRVGPQLARVLRVLRVSRLFRLLNKYRGLQALLQTITFSLPSLMNVFALLMLVYFIFAVLGVFMFSTITQGKIIDPVFMNFQNFTQAMIILLRISTGESWPIIMYDTMNTSPDCIDGVNCGTALAPLFFIVFVMICSYVMLNLFVLIILQQFEMYYLPDDNILQTFGDDLEKFKLVWLKYSQEHGSVRIRQIDLERLLRELTGNLAYGNITDKELLRHIVKMDLEADDDGYIYFNEVLYRIMKRVYGFERTKKKALIDKEVDVFNRIRKLRDKMIMNQRKTARIQAATMNPFLAIMYKNMSFRAWTKIYKGNTEKRQNEKDYQIERESSDEEFDQAEQNQKQINEDYDYVTEQDLSCHSDDEDDNDFGEFKENNNDNSQKPLNVHSVSQLIDDLDAYVESASSPSEKSLQSRINSQRQSYKNESLYNKDEYNTAQEQPQSFKITLKKAIQVDQASYSSANLAFVSSPPIVKAQKGSQKFFGQDLKEQEDQIIRETEGDRLEDNDKMEEIQSYFKNE